MRGGSSVTSTLYLRFMRSTVISTCMLPTPETKQLLRLRIELVVNRRILFLNARQRVRDLVLVAARLGLDREVDGGLRERDARQLEGMRLVAERVAGERLLELLGHADLAGPELAHGLLRLTLQPRHVTHALPGSSG